MGMVEATEIDRLALRQRPDGRPAMRMSWGKLLFMHWPVRASSLRPLIPERLSIDEMDGTAWIGVVPFTMWGIRKIGCPPVPTQHAFHELNVRTYVHLEGQAPGVWFFSLDAARRLAVTMARRLYRLPYYHARMHLEQFGKTIRYNSRRIHHGAEPALFEATWEIGRERPETTPESLDFFLTERYCLYSARGEDLYRARIFHEPWPLREAKVRQWRSSMLEALELHEPDEEPRVAYAESIDVDVWGLERV